MLKELINAWKSNNLLDQAWEQSYEMLETTEDMFNEAVRVLRESEDEDIRQEIRAKDKMVNSYEREVRRKVTTHLSIHCGTDIVASLVLISIIIDLERLGDYTKNIVDLIGYRKGATLSGQHLENDLKKIENAVKENFKRTKECLENSDSQGAKQLLLDLDWVAEACDSGLKNLVKEKNETISAGDSASLAVYFRWLKRIHRHLANVTTSVVNPFDRIGFDPK